jgi:sterol desaturase/sphingolipid hydroxylase (fatty acid hydroxylase superfamily)
MLDAMLEWVLLAARGVAWPFYEFLIDGKSRYFWVYCASGVAIAIYAHSLRGRPGVQPLLRREVWLSRSSQNDYLIVVLGAAMRFTILSWAFFNWEPIAGFVVGLLQAAGVAGQVTDGAAIALGLMMTITLFVVDDFVRWYMHFLMHRIPELWEFHKVHHSAEELNFLTAERHHPFEIIATTAATTLSFGLVNGLFIGLFGDQLTITTVFGANLLLVVFNIAGGVLRHSPVWISFGPRIERWIISPAMHQIHHSERAEHFDKNIGSSLAIWDRWFGTLHIPKGREVEGYGIGPETPDFRSLSVIYFRPFIRSAEMIRSRLRLRGSSAPTPPTADPADAA